MTILPKKKPSSGVGVSDHADDSDRRSSSDPHQHPHPHSGRTGARPRASPPPWSYQPAPPSARDDRRSIEASSRPQQASPPPVGSVSPVGPGDGRDSSGGMLAGSRGELVVSAGVVGCGGGIGSCCSGPGLSKRRRQAGTCSGGVAAALAGGGQPGVTGPGGVGSSQDTEEGAGNNSEDEYENAARLQSMDPATVEQYADQSLMKSAIKTSEESWIEQQMLEDKKRATDWEATNEAIEEQVARESYLQWLQDQEKQARQPRKASATCSSATAAASSGLDDWSARSPRQRDSDPSHSDLTTTSSTNNKPPSPAGAALILSKPPSPCAPGPSNQSRHHLEYRAIMQEMSPTAFGLTDWEDDEILASVLAVSQQEYLDSIKHQSTAMHREREPSPDSS
ncbi:hypothetical protein F2P81_011384 [Scophthalmus maximus]|uniref:Uncharacterized protein n=1 Tax=Scophthalmus maximus TaxID=52904 RepID=A0A6A4T1F3_SCOMX|nr:hypothetical protein F2P81_011384 [Scophthalmus maximus]